MTLALTILGGLLVAYSALLAALWFRRPPEGRLREALRLLPDVARLVGRLARDPAVPRRARVGLWLLLVYLLMPVDLVPDFVPVLGYADDVVVVAIVLRSVVRRAGPGALDRHWSGSDRGLTLVRRLAGITDG